MKFLRLSFLLLLAPVCSRAGGDEVVVIYNTRVPESKAIAEYYARARQVPEYQIYGFKLTTNEEMSRIEFHDELQTRLARRLESDGFWRFEAYTIPAANGQPARVGRRVIAAKIRYAVLCAGIPLKIAVDQVLRASANTNQRPEMLRNEAAVDSELAWLPMIEMNPPLGGPLRNWVYGATNTALLNPTNGILLVTRLDGPSAEVARGLVDRALEAERDGLWGRAYFDARGLGQTQTNYLIGDEWILGAAKLSRALGFETVVDNKPDTFPASFPLSQAALYAGWYSQDADGPFAQPKVEFMPGAFAYHLHSYSAATLRSATAFWCGPLLAKGATCTMGCVYEPYLALTPNVALFLERFAVSRFTFGEAAWAAQPALSWQTTVVGDPLYRPFGKSPEVLLDELKQRRSPLIEWYYLRLVDAGLSRGTPVFQAVSFLENLPVATNSAVLTEKLADLYESQGKPSSAIDTYQRALKLNPSREQRIRLRLTLGEKLLAQNSKADAESDYRKLLEESPDYPGKVMIEEKLQALQPKPAGTNAPAK